MTDIFELPVKYKEQNLRFPSQLILKDGSHRVCVHLDETDVYFERDEENHFHFVVLSRIA